MKAELKHVINSNLNLEGHDGDVVDGMELASYLNLNFSKYNVKANVEGRTHGVKALYNKFVALNIVPRKQDR